MMNVKKAIITDIEYLNAIYNDAFESNPCPDNLIEDDDDEPDLIPEIAMNNPDKIVLSFFEDGNLIGGAIIDNHRSDINILDRLFISPCFQRKGYGYQAWQEIEKNFSTGLCWKLRTPTYLINNACFYINKCGFSITEVEDIGEDGIGMFVFTKHIKI